MKRILFPLITGILLGIASPAHSAPVPPPEKLLPADTLVMLTVPDWDKSGAALKDAPFNRLWRDPEMKPFVDHFNAGLQKDFVQPMEKELGFKLGEFTNLVHGQFTIGVVQDGWQGKTGEEPAFILLLDVKDQTSRLSKLLADLRTKWNESGRKIKEETIRGVSFTVLMISPAEIGKAFDKSKPGDNEPSADSTDKSKADKPFPLLVGQNGSLLLVGTSSRVIEQVLVRQGGGSVSSLSELASYEKNHTALFRDANFSVWANARAFTDILLKSKPEPDASPNSNPLGYTPEKIVTALGLKGLRTLAMSATLSGDGMLGRFAMTIPESERRGLFTILTPETKDASPLPFVQADVTKFNRWRLNGQKVWGTF
ncbi:MAG TPA: hypothetical protein VK968_12695 [Roseimicrobium sp.]|nr:hypothetical protein [Roseimicrobium sp.]